MGETFRQLFRPKSVRSSRRAKRTGQKHAHECSFTSRRVAERDHRARASHGYNMYTCVRRSLSRHRCVSIPSLLRFPVRCHRHVNESFGGIHEHSRGESTKAHCSISANGHIHWLRCAQTRGNGLTNQAIFRLVQWRCVTSEQGFSSLLRTGLPYTRLCNCSYQIRGDE